MISQFHAIVETAVDGIILSDAVGKVLTFNPACERIFGYSSDEIVGADIRCLMPAPYRDGHDGYMATYRNTGQRKIIGIGREVMGKRKSGEIFPMDLSIGEVATGGSAAFVGILRDVTERRRGEEQRQLLIEQLAKINAEQTHFVHAASHDLREPLRMITAFCGRLHQEYGASLDKRAGEYLSLSISAANRMSALLDDLVEFAQLTVETERAQLFDSGVALEQELDNFAEVIRRTHAVITHGELPNLLANPIRFARLMQNLVGNALKYVAEGVTPRIRVEAVRENAFWRFSVSDNGIGIDSRYYDRIFEPFKRLHTRGRYNGTGLGLAICRKIVEGFGGAISVQSNEGQGSTFSFTIPAAGEEVIGHDGTGD